MTQRLSTLLCVVLVGLLAGVPQTAVGQDPDLPEEARQALEERGLSLEEARRQARQLGIDLSNPREAARRARQLGIPEARIEALLQAVQGAQAAPSDSLEGRMEIPTNPPFPVLAGTPVIRPDSVAVDRLPRTIEVEVPIRSRNQLRRVEPGFLTAGGDSVMVSNVRRLRGSVIDGTWTGSLTVPPDTSAGTWSLFVRAATRDTSVVLATGRRLQIFPPGELPKRDTTRRAAKDTLRYFGYDTFDTIPEAFTPEQTGPVDGSYVVGPNDELRLTVWGGAEFSYTLPVDRGGRVTVPNVGQFTVAGKTLDELRSEMKTWLSRSYSGLTSDPPTVFMDLTLTRVRPTQVFVLGEVAQPGGYVVSSSATVFNALYSVGGPLRRGSLRNIKVIRDGEVVETVDLYDYLLRGYSPDPVQLQSNDYVFVPPRGETVAITGPVRRPAYYEMREDETLEDLLTYAGGLKPRAYARRFQIDRIVPFGQRNEPSVARAVKDFSLQTVRSDTASVELADGDHVEIFSITDSRDPAVSARVDAVTVTGAVFQPGQYELGGGVRTVQDLIERADGLTGDAYRAQAHLVRIEDDLDESSRELNLHAVLNDEPQENVVLQPGDSLHVASVREMREARTVRISGQVRDPGTYRYREGMSVQNLLLKGGGLTDDEYLKDVFLGRADLFRVARDGGTERVIPFHLGEALDGEGMADRTLRPGDEIRVYEAAVQRLEDRFVNVTGAVRDTGRYDYRDNMSLKDLLVLAGGFEEGASLREVEVTRMIDEGEGDGRRAETIRVPLVRQNAPPSAVSFSVRDTANALRAAAAFDLQHRDRVFVRTDPSFEPQETVTIRGEVKYPGEYTLLRDNERLSSLVERSGGVLSTGYLKGGRLRRKGEQVIVEMGAAVRGNRAEDVILQPGDEIVIPTRPNTVAVRGNVANEGLLKHEEGRRVEYYLERAGGERDSTQAIYLSQASGATFRVDTGWFSRTPKVDEGAVIRVTRKQPPGQKKDGVDVSQVITEVTGILSSALTVIVLATRAFN